MVDHSADSITLVKKDLVESLSAELKMTKAKAQVAVQHVLDHIASHVGTGGRVELRDHFVLEVRAQAPRAVRNPRTGERVMLPGRRVVRFRPGRRMRNGLAALSQAERPAQRNGQAPAPTSPPLRIVGVDAARTAADAGHGPRVGAP